MSIEGILERKSVDTCFHLKGKKLATDDAWILMVVFRMHKHTTAEHLECHSFANKLSSGKTSLLGK